MAIRQRFIDRSRRLSRTLRMIDLAEATAPLGFWELEIDSGQQAWSAGLHRMFGLDCAERLCPGDAEMLFADGAAELQRAIDANRTNRRVYGFDVNVMRVDRVQRVFQMNARNMMGPDGQPNRIVAVVRDISEVRAREQELMASKKQAAEARRQAETDPLTGLANRRRVMEFLDQAILRCSKSEKPASLVMLDIDHFKSVNDTYGHQAGDEVLKQVARIAQGNARSRDLVGRMGGEEFVVCMEDAGHSTVLTVAERLRHAIGRGSAAGQAPPVTVSVGYAVWQPGDSSLTLFARADQALYAAKEGGRNQVRKAA